jgi:16S rRNA (adenine1518-N6/adenine1519-N6)-dimethyltransferase|tara:strand:+ start:239 stop:1033 length:795 start_codon:yes stop_codon:yes gene_type:complete
MKIKHPKKSLGQNFLTDKNIVDIIINAGDINKNDTILEVGPGTGRLTEKILSKNPRKVFAVEKDKFLAKKLSEKFREKIILINDDILKIDEKKYSNNPIIVFGNLPYNISTQILVKWIRYKNLNNTFKKFILMFQKEVAERIIAETNSKNYGRLAVLSSWKLQIEKIVDVSPNSFYPVPKVKSTVLLIKPKSEYFNLKNSKNLEHITNIFFNQRRKMIKKPLNIIFKNVNEISKKLNININDRPQNLSSLKYFEICKEYESLNL